MTRHGAGAFADRRSVPQGAEVGRREVRDHAIVFEHIVESRTLVALQVSVRSTAPKTVVAGSTVGLDAT